MTEATKTGKTYTQSEMLEAILPYKRSATWLKDVRAVIENTFDQCPGTLSAKLKEKSGKYTQWGLERFVEFFEATKNTQIIEKKGKPVEQPCKPKMSRVEWQESVWATYSRRRQVEVLSPFEEVSTDQASDQASDQQVTDLVLVQFEDETPNVVAELVEQTSLIRHSGEESIEHNRDAFNFKIAQFGDFIKETVRQTVLSNGLQGINEAYEELAQVANGQVSERQTTISKKKSSQR